MLEPNSHTKQGHSESQKGESKAHATVVAEEQQNNRGVGNKRKEKFLDIQNLKDTNSNRNNHDLHEGNSGKEKALHLSLIVLLAT